MGTQKKNLGLALKLSKETTYGGEISEGREVWLSVALQGNQGWLTSGGGENNLKSSGDPKKEDTVLGGVEKVFVAGKK